MPGMTGVALARELRLRRAELPVILASGYSDELARSACEGVEFLAKPYSADQVSRILLKAIRKNNCRRRVDALAHARSTRFKRKRTDAPSHC